MRRIAQDEPKLVHDAIWPWQTMLPLQRVQQRWSEPNSLSLPWSPHEGKESAEGSSETGRGRTSWLRSRAWHPCVPGGSPANLKANPPRIFHIGSAAAHVHASGWYFANARGALCHPAHVHAVYPAGARRLRRASRGTSVIDTSHARARKRERRERSPQPPSRETSVTVTSHARARKRERRECSPQPHRYARSLAARRQARLKVELQRCMGHGHTWFSLSPTAVWLYSCMQAFGSLLSRACVQCRLSSVLGAAQRVRKSLSERPSL